MPERTFSEEQIRTLLKRATQLHMMEEAEGPGLTLAEVEQIAADAGIPPKYLREALDESQDRMLTRNVSGHTKTHVFVERSVPGELTESEWESVVLRLRKEYTNDMADVWGLGAAMPQYGRGVTERLGNLREWRHTTSLGIVTTLSISAKDGRQHINLQRRVGVASPRTEGFGYGLVMAVVVASVIGAIAQSPLVFLLAMMVATALFAPAIAVLDKRWRDRKLSQMHGVVDEIAEIVQSSERAAVREGEKEAERVRLRQEALEEARREVASQHSPSLEIDESTDVSTGDSDALRSQRERA